MSLDPNDVLPRRNLPPEAENWGRQLERVVEEGEKAVSCSRQRIYGTGRALTAQMSNLSATIDRLAAGVQSIYTDPITATVGGDGEPVFFPAYTTIQAPEWASTMMVHGGRGFDVSKTPSCNVSDAFQLVSSTEPGASPYLPYSATSYDPTIRVASAEFFVSAVDFTRHPPSHEAGVLNFRPVALVGISGNVYLSIAHNPSSTPNFTTGSFVFRGELIVSWV